MNASPDRLRVEEQERANNLVRRVARLLGAPMGVEARPELSEDSLIHASHAGWRVDVYLELDEAAPDDPTALWVLILSHGDVRSYRTFRGDAAAAAAEHVRRFAADEGYRRLWLDVGARQRRDARAAGKAHAAKSSPHLNRRILVIEDKEDTAEALRMLLELVGYEVRVARTGPDGLKQAAAWKPVAVLCDIGLPGLDGYAVAAELRRNPATAGALLVAVTGYGAPEDQVRARRAGFDHHFTKPADPLMLLQVLPRPAPGTGIG